MFFLYCYRFAGMTTRAIERNIAARGQLCTAFAKTIVVESLAFRLLNDPLSSVIVALLYLMLFVPLPKIMLVKENSAQP